MCDRHRLRASATMSPTCARPRCRGRSSHSSATTTTSHAVAPAARRAAPSLRVTPSRAPFSPTSLQAVQSHRSGQAATSIMLVVRSRPAHQRSRRAARSWHLSARLRLASRTIGETTIIHSREPCANVLERSVEPWSVLEHVAWSGVRRRRVLLGAAAGAGRRICCLFAHCVTVLWDTLSHRSTRVAQV